MPISRERYKSQETLDEEFKERLTYDPTTKCWEWNQDIFRFRHGYLIFNPRRYAYQMVGKTIPKGRNLMASCGNKLCVNPDHAKLKHSGADADRDTPLYYDILDFQFPDKHCAKKYHVTKQQANDARRRTLQLIVEVKRSRLSATRLGTQFKCAPSFILELKAVTLDEFELLKIDPNEGIHDDEDVNPEGLKFKL